MQFQIPALLLIYYAGDIGDRGFATLGTVTEPVLQAMGIRYYILRRARRNRRDPLRRANPGGRFQETGSRATNQKRSRSRMMQRYDYLKAIAGRRR